MSIGPIYRTGCKSSLRVFIVINYTASSSQTKLKLRDNVKT